jgi:hypothetical protein
LRASLNHVAIVRKRRLWVTETPPVKEALDELRAVLGTDQLPFEEIVIRGAAIKIAELREEDDEPSRSHRDFD